ncbi:MAG: TRAP transporter fused permease subunit [Hyphomonadaceae bacterium]|jgi:TRAP transporter 4TM/12TM fusion protein|nr:TRAP transporter fused permease subunit [Hyphomonadaceae bacterium]
MAAEPQRRDVSLEEALSAGALAEDKRKKVEELIEEEEGATNRLGGWLGTAVVAFAVGVSVIHLYAAVAGSPPFTGSPIIPTYTLRPLHVGLVLALIYVLYPFAKSLRNRVTPMDWLCAGASLLVLGYILYQGPEFGDRAIDPEPMDFYVGIVLIVLLLEATRRSTGWIMPVVSLCFIAYALLGKHLPPPWTHRGYSIERLVGHLYMTLEGIFGTTVDVSSSLIILFTIFGAILQYSGAGKFFIDFSFAAMGGKRNAAGRAVVLSSFLLGGPSGSGVATTVTIGTVAYPLLEKAGYEKNAAGGLLAAGGLGAIISPPVLGAAAFLIAEFLKISYLEVIWMAAIPTLLYYFSILVMVELDAAKYGGGAALLVEKGTLWRLTKGYWFHFGSLVSIIVLMLYGFSPVLSVFWATMLAIAVSYLRRDTALVPPKLVRALAEGTTGVLSIAATCATAGIIVGVTTLTGLGQRFADIIIGYAQGSLVLTALFSAAIVWVVGLAVPVTASYIMCAVIAAPALIKLGVPDFAAHMFIFYYAVLSEVSPPTALSPFAAAAITGGSPYRTTLQAWKYTMPAFLVPFVFVCDPLGVGLLFKIPPGGSWLDILRVSIETMAGIAILGFAFQGRFLRKSTLIETVLFTIAGMLLVFPELIATLLRPVGIALAYPHVLAFALAGVAVLVQWVRPGPAQEASRS